MDILDLVEAARVAVHGVNGVHEEFVSENALRNDLFAADIVLQRANVEDRRVFKHILVQTMRIVLIEKAAKKLRELLARLLACPVAAACEEGDFETHFRDARRD